MKKEELNIYSSNQKDRIENELYLKFVVNLLHENITFYEFRNQILLIEKELKNDIIFLVKYRRYDKLNKLIEIEKIFHENSFVSLYSIDKNKVKKVINENINSKEK